MIEEKEQAKLREEQWARECFPEVYGDDNVCC